MNGFIFGTILFLSLPVFAQNLDETAQEKLIEKLTQVNLNLPPSDASRASITLRLADLHAERARRLSMKELNQGCTVCTAGSKDREKAIRLYNEVMPTLENEQKARVNTQIGHLHELSGQESKAMAIYESLLNDKNEKISSEAQLSLAEIYFKKRNYGQALTFYKKVMQSNSSQKGLATYRAGWCLFNQGQIEQGVTELKKVLQTPELLSRSQSGVISLDIQFQEEVSRDLATFLARRPFSETELDTLYKLSPENAKLAHLSYLASEYERLGQVPAAIAAWRYSIQRQSEPKARMEGHVHLAQLQAAHQNRKEAVRDYETALSLWSNLGNCVDDTCKQLKVRLRQFVLDWNTIEKKTPSQELLESYQKYLAVFPAEVDMRLWQAQVAAQLKDYELSVRENLLVATTLSQEAKSQPKMEKARKDWLEVSLLAAIENAELSKNNSLVDKTTQAYLDLSIERKKEMDVRYQRAHMVYEAGQYSAAAEQMRALALDKKAPSRHPLESRRPIVGLPRHTQRRHSP
jgi:tetratricopeptide (TPR) repeat protein